MNYCRKLVMTYSDKEGVVVEYHHKTKVARYKVGDFSEGVVLMRGFMRGVDKWVD